MPDIGTAEYLVQMLQNVGISSNNGMGLAPLSWTELDSWCKLTKTQLSPWESEMMVHLSRQYVMKHYEFDKKDIMSEHNVEITVIDRAKVSDKVGAFFRMLMDRRDSDE